MARNTFAVFMEPNFDVVMDLPEGKTEHDSAVDRFKKGMTFGDFSKVSRGAACCAGECGVSGVFVWCRGVSVGKCERCMRDSLWFSGHHRRLLRQELEGILGVSCMRIPTINRTSRDQLPHNRCKQIGTTYTEIV